MSCGDLGEFFLLRAFGHCSSMFRCDICFFLGRVPWFQFRQSRLAVLDLAHRDNLNGRLCLGLRLIHT